MVASRRRPKSLRLFGLTILMFGLMPASIGYQDYVSLVTRQPAPPPRARAQLLASPFGTLHAATFGFHRPIGTLIPDPPRVVLASLDVTSSDATATVADDTANKPTNEVPVEFPSVIRRLKGDSLVPHRPPEPEIGPSRDLTPGRIKTVSFPRPADDNAVPAASSVVTASPEREPLADTPQPYSLASLPDTTTDDPPLAAPIDEISPAARLAHLYFGIPPAGTQVGSIEPWPAEQNLIVIAPQADPEIKRVALAPRNANDAKTPTGETVAPKGKLSGPDQRPRTPAEKLGLTAKARVKAEKCLAEAIYFESRGEPKRGQMAVAQVVMNRVFSGFYPNNICGVVYQNVQRRNACQFTFACDGIPDIVTEPEMWKQAQEIARDTLDGKLWLPEIGYSTHYHAYWVHPSWAREMRKLQRIGVHSFYRPRAWGDSVEVPNYTFVPPAQAKM